jgi:hypothetical protein
MVSSSRIRQQHFPQQNNNKKRDMAMLYEAVVACLCFGMALANFCSY